MLAVVATVTLSACSGSTGTSTESATSSAATTSTTTSMGKTDTMAEHLDVQGHRGGRGEYTEESRAAFEHALNLGVTTLELDVVMSRDGVPVVWHDPVVQKEKCTDTKPVTEGDADYPYVGKLLHELTFEQIQTLNCDRQLKDFPDAKAVAGNKMLQLRDVFALAKEKNANDVFYNIETKIEGEHHEQSAEPEEFVEAIVGEAQKAGVVDHITIQSFDWRSLEIVQKTYPDIPTVALYDETTWFKGSPWIGSVDFDAVKGDALDGVKALGADAVSPGYAVPYGKKAGEDGFNPTATKDYVDRAHELGLKVVPWTVNDEATMRNQIEAGVDGLISDFPTLLVKVAQEYGWKPGSYALKQAQ